MQRGIGVRDDSLNMNREQWVADLKFGESVVSLLQFRVYGNSHCGWSRVFQI
jgi:hypothetical protein